MRDPETSEVLSAFTKHNDTIDALETWIVSKSCAETDDILTSRLRYILQRVVFELENQIQEEYWDNKHDVDDFVNENSNDASHGIR